MPIYNYQKEGVLSIERFNGRALLADEMGLGKTLQALYWLRRNDLWPALIVCPASVKYNWERESVKRIKIQPIVFEGRKPTNGRLAKISIINYDILQHWRSRFRNENFRAIVVDESQFCTNRRAKRTKCVLELSKRCENFLALSGTPLTNRPAELWPVLNMTRPDVYKSFWSYAFDYCAPKQTPWGWDFKGSCNLDQLHAELKQTLMIRRTKADVMSELPELMREIVLLPLSDEREYQKANRDFLSWLREKDSAKARRAASSESMTKVGYLLRLAAELKVKAAAEWVNMFLDDSDEKLVLFYYHKAFVKLLKTQVRANHVTIDGSVTGRKRQQAIKQFAKDRQVRLVFAQIKACGTGVDGLQVASNAAVCELFWNPGTHSQAEARLHRIGLESTAWIWYLVARGTIEERLLQLIQSKQKILSTVLDGASNEDDFDVFDLLVKEVRKMNESYWG